MLGTTGTLVGTIRDSDCEQLDTGEGMACSRPVELETTGLREAGHREVAFGCEALLSTIGLELLGIVGRLAASWSRFFILSFNLLFLLFFFFLENDEPTTTVGSRAESNF